jgi:hypothetical protein
MVHGLLINERRAVVFLTPLITIHFTLVGVSWNFLDTCNVEVELTITLNEEKVTPQILHNNDYFKKYRISIFRHNF